MWRNKRTDKRDKPILNITVSLISWKSYFYINDLFTFTLMASLNTSSLSFIQKRLCLYTNLAYFARSSHPFSKEMPEMSCNDHLTTWVFEITWKKIQWLHTSFWIWCTILDHLYRWTLQPVWTNDKTKVFY